MNINEVAKLTELSPRQIREYEKLGLLQTIQRTDSGYRIFSDTQLQRLKFIKHARDVGFSLAQIEALLPKANVVDLYPLGYIKERKFYTPKYWVAKIKEDTDVLIQTAHKSLSDCQKLTERLFLDAVLKDEIVYITVELRNVG